jgi:hydrocephalus-inducing protein
VVTVEFSAVEKRVCEAKLVLEVLDVQELQGVAHSLPLPIKGEAYKIEIDINFPQVRAGTDALTLSSDCSRRGFYAVDLISMGDT